MGGGQTGKRESGTEEEERKKERKRVQAGGREAKGLSSVAQTGSVEVIRGTKHSISPLPGGERQNQARTEDTGMRCSKAGILWPSALPPVSSCSVESCSDAYQTKRPIVI